MDHVVREVKVVREAAGSTTEGASGSAPAPSFSAEEAAVDGAGARPEPADLTLPGCWGALIFACLSFTPSLLPRGGVVQGLVTGITAAIGYGLGVLAAAIWRAFADRDARRARRWAWRIFLDLGGWCCSSVSFGLGQYWQHEIRGLMGVTEHDIAARRRCRPFIAALMFGLLVQLGRGLRGSTAGSLGCSTGGSGRGPRSAVGLAAVVGLT